MARKSSGQSVERGIHAVSTSPAKRTSKRAEARAPQAVARPSSLLDIRVIYCGDKLEQLAKLPDTCIDLIYTDPPFNSNRSCEIFWGESKEKRAFEDRHEELHAPELA